MVVTKYLTLGITNSVLQLENHSQFNKNQIMNYGLCQKNTFHFRSIARFTVLGKRESTTIEQTLNGYRTDIARMLNRSRMELSVLFYFVVRTKVQELNPRSGEQYDVKSQKKRSKKESVRLSEACDASANTMRIGAVRLAIFLPTTRKLLACMCAL